MIAEPFAFGDSPMHRADPRLRAVFGAAFAFVTAVAWEFDAILAALFLAVAMAAAARLSPWRLAKRLFFVNGFIALLWIVVPATYPGRAVFSLGPVHLSADGLWVVARITIKSNAIVLSTLALLATMPMASLGQAMYFFRVPQKLVMLILLTYRYMFVMEKEYGRLLRAARVRGFSADTSMNTWRTLGYLLGMLFVRADQRARRVHQAMLCRGFSGRYPSLDAFCFRKTDWAWAAAMVCALALVGGLEWAKWPLS
ncbi:MAG: cobalt ECF transporter T component CbiQ [Deltaproteobacteria bacterium]|nr:cobalt ECF transporter T component CbiQ [Deltaproteobacteria bacterium]